MVLAKPWLLSFKSFDSFLEIKKNFKADLGSSSKATDGSLRMTPFDGGERSSDDSPSYLSQSVLDERPPPPGIYHYMRNINSTQVILNVQVLLLHT